MAWLHRHEGPEGATWHVRWRDAGGRRHSRSLGAMTPEAAELERIRVEVIEEGRPARLEDVKPGEAVVRWVASLEVQGRREGTLDYVRRRMAPLAARWAAVPLRQWSRPMLEAYLAGRSWGPRSIQMTVRAARQFRAWCVACGIACGDFASGVKGPRVSTSEPDHYSPDELRALLAASKGTDVELPVHLSVYAGLAYGDLRALTWSEVDVEGGWISRPRQKTGVPLRLPVLAALKACLERHRAVGGVVCRSWPESKRGAYDALYRLQDEAGVERGGWHRIRHSFASLLHAEGVDLATISRLMGHRAGSAVTLRYLHADESRLREGAAAVERALG